ncbi:hypothetical protein APORC_1154 [Arcobacter porcinus]|uniref:Lipoprotein n=1 Tax=Arcobacter porcinus TaxID=1935204 RepID=A0A5C2HCX9_9BACT|nr:hypothetical protein APORC_1154 [Arcobacter porcinus]
MSKNFINIFHGVIIAIFIFSFSACGYKADPVYTKTEQR